MSAYSEQLRTDAARLEGYATDPANRRFREMRATWRYCAALFRAIAAREDQQEQAPRATPGGNPL